MKYRSRQAKKNLPSKRQKRHDVSSHSLAGWLFEGSDPGKYDDHLKRYERMAWFSFLQARAKKENQFQLQRARREQEEQVHTIQSEVV